MPTSMELDINGPVHVVDHGGEGRPILLVHGLGGSHVNWSAVAQPLTEFGSVRAIDLIGFGRTPLAGRSSAVESQCDLVVAYLRVFGQFAYGAGAGKRHLVAQQTLFGLRHRQFSRNDVDLWAA